MVFPAAFTPSIANQLVPPIALPFNVKVAVETFCIAQPGVGVKVNVRK